MQPHTHVLSTHMQTLMYIQAHKSVKSIFPAEAPAVFLNNYESSNSSCVLMISAQLCTDLNTPPPPHTGTMMSFHCDVTANHVSERRGQELHL